MTKFKSEFVFLISNILGAFAVYLEPWYADIYEFLELKKNHGKVCFLFIKYIPFVLVVICEVN